MADSDVRVLVQSAARAPSVHNTQPWRFDVGDDGIAIVADRSRQLRFLDPNGRQLHISCGAASEFGYLAARAMGRECAVEVLPEPREPDVLARLRLGGTRAPTDEESRLARAMSARYTDRGPYSDEPVPPQVVADAQRRAAQLDVWIRQVISPDDRRTVIAVLAAAEAAEASDSRYAEELARWTARAAAGEGMPPAATGPDWPPDRVSDVPLRDFGGANVHPRPGGRPEAGPPSVERDLLVMIGTATDDPRAWLASGRALAWLLLRAATDAVSAQPLGQAVDLPASRDRLRHEMSLVGHPQFLLRLGHGSGQPTTQRRSHVD